VWANLFGRGVVDPADDLRVTNPPSNEELLAAVTEDFIASGFDLKHLIRVIMNSATYQASSRQRDERQRRPVLLTLRGATTTRQKSSWMRCRR
jgi:hypothetical protein